MRQVSNILAAAVMLSDTHHDNQSVAKIKENTFNSQTVARINLRVNSFARVRHIVLAKYCTNYNRSAPEEFVSEESQKQEGTRSQIYSSNKRSPKSFHHPTTKSIYFSLA